MASIRLSTAGVSIQYCVESSAGQRPTTGYKVIPEIKSIPEINPEPSTLETTTLGELEYKTYIDGLKDMGGALSFTANLTEDFKTAWDTMYQAYVTAKGEGKRMAFAIVIPDLKDACYFYGNPSKLGSPAAEVDAVLEINAYITPVSAPEFAAKPTGE